MHEVFIKTHFSAAHHLRDYTGKCANQHGHNWLVEVYCTCKELNDVGMAIDFVDLKREVSALLESLDHTDLNELPHFQRHNPTSENLARYICDQLAGRLNDKRVSVSKVVVYETPNCGSSYSPSNK